MWGPGVALVWASAWRYDRCPSPAPIHHHQPTMTDFRALCAELLDILAEHSQDLYVFEAEAITRARAAVDKPEGEGPGDQELERFLAERHRARMESESAFGCTDFDGAKARAARIADTRAALARWGNSVAPAPKPIPVSERPWEREGWCDAEGRCWSCNAYSMGKWTYETAPDSEQDWGILGTKTHSLPHWAIARPRPKAKEPT